MAPRIQNDVTLRHADAEAVAGYLLAYADRLAYSLRRVKLQPASRTALVHELARVRSLSDRIMADLYTWEAR